MKERPDDIVFVVRMWQQRDDGGDAEWRGSIHQIDSGSRFYVTGPREVADVISSRLASEPRSAR